MANMNKINITDTPDEVSRKIGSRLAAIRLGRNLSQAELAKRAGVSKRSLERLESGEGNPQMAVFVATCVALGLTSGFETLLPALELSPEDVFKGRTLRKRARTTTKQKMVWGDEK